MYNCIGSGGGNIVIYADVLLLVNFSMDILTLYAAGRLTNKKMTKCRIIAASVVGSVIATTITLIFDSDTITARLASVASLLVASVIMTLISYGKYKRIRQLIRDSIIVWGAGALLGGIMTVILSLGETVSPETRDNYPPVFLLCTLSTLGFLRFIITSRSQKSETVLVLVRGEKIKISSLCDTGSFAADPISGIPAILVKSRGLSNIAAELYSENCDLRLRMIPIDSVGGARMIRGFIPERVWVGDKEVSAVIAVDTNEGSYRGHDGLIPAALCK